MAEELVTTCPFCGQKFTGPGNSTRGYWEANGKTKEEDAKFGEIIVLLYNKEEVVSSTELSLTKY